MSYAAVQRELETYFTDNWPDTPVVFDNVPKPDINDNNTWVRLTITYSSARQVSMGAGSSNFHRFQGVANVQIFAPLDVGSKPALELADKVVGLFTGNRIGQSQMFTAETQILGDDGFNRYQVNVVCPFYFDNRI